MEKRNIFLNHQKPTRDESEFVPCSVAVGKSHRFPRKISIDFPFIDPILYPSMLYFHLGGLTTKKCCYNF